MHRRFGKLPWKDLFAAAIGCAEAGDPVHEGMHEIWASAGVVRGLRGTPSLQKFFFLMASGRDRRAVQEPWNGQELLADRRERSRCFPQRGDRGRHRQNVPATRRHYDGVGSASFASEWLSPISIDYRG